MRERRVRAFVPMLALGLLLASPLCAHARSCSARDAAAADEQVDHLDTWAKVEFNFRRFGHCDDGSIAEGNSEAIARLLIDQWDTMPALVRLIQRTPRLQPYILRHIDETLDTDDVERIGQFASSGCVAGASDLCEGLRAKVSSLKRLANQTAAVNSTVPRSTNSRPSRRRP